MRIYSIEYAEDGIEKKNWFSNRAAASKGLTSVKREKKEAEINPNINEHDIVMNKTGILEFLNKLTN